MAEIPYVSGATTGSSARVSYGDSRDHAACNAQIAAARAAGAREALSALAEALDAAAGEVPGTHGAHAYRNSAGLARDRAAELAQDRVRTGLGEPGSTGRASPDASGSEALEAAVEAHADPALDAHPGLGPTSPCGLCGVPGMPQRHRVVDAIAERHAAGEALDELAEDYGVPLDAVETVAEWAKRWPGAWQ